MAILCFVLALAAVFGFIICYVGPGMAGNFFGQTAATISETFNDILGVGSRSKLAAEIDLGGINPAQMQKEEIPASSSRSPSAQKSGSEPATNFISSPSASGPTNKKSNVEASGSEGVAGQDYEVAESSTAQNKSQTQTASNGSLSASVSVCDFNIENGPTHQIIFNEIAWMGSPTQASETPALAAKREWIELKNNSGGDLNLSGTQVTDESGNFKIVFGDEKFPAGAVYLLERTSDNAVPGISADKIYTGTLSNSGMALKFFGRDCILFDEVNAAEGWPAGDNSTKHTMSRNPYDLGWYTSGAPGGTPKAANNDALLAVSSPPPQPSVPTSEDQTSSSPPAGQSQAPSQSGTVSALLHLVIAEVQITGGAGQTTNDFVRIFNPLAGPFNLKGYRLVKRTKTGTSDTSLKSWTSDAFVPAGGYYTWANSSFTSLTPSADTVTTGSIADDNGVAIREGPEDTGQVIDSVAWGASQNAFIEGSAYPDNPAANQVLSRKFVSGSIVDTDNNSQDFELR